MKIRVALIAGALLWVSVAMAQPYTSTLGRFQVDQIKGCAPFTVTLTNLLAGNCNGANPCSMDFEGKGQQTLNLFTFQYTAPGIYNLQVLYQGQGADNITITVVKNTEPDFEIYSCANSDVTIKVLEKSYQQLVIDFDNDGIPETIIPSGNNATAFHDYATPGNKSISVRGLNLNSADNCDSKVQTFNALASLPAPTINKLTTLDKSQIKLDFITQPHIQYRLEIAVNSAGPFQQLATLYDTATFTVSNLNAEANYYCFRLGAYDICNGLNNYSNVICSPKFDLNIQSGVNKLSWTTANVGIQNIEVERDGATHTVIPGAPTGFDDIDIECKTNYCYRVINRYAGGVTSESLQFCGESFKVATPPAINNASSVVTPQGLDIEWIQDPASAPAKYNILIANDGQTFGNFGTSTTTKFLHKAYLSESSFTYRIDYTDECGNKSPEGIIINPIRMTGTMDDNIISLKWTDYEGWNNGVLEYIVDKFDIQDKLIKSVNVGVSNTFIDDEADPNHQYLNYRIRANAIEGGIKASVSNSIGFTKDSKIFYPTAFSPNGDKLNDLFFVKGQFIVKIELSIFNRWGELIFNSNKKDDTWDGTFNGKPVAEDAYVWSAQVTDLAGRTYKETGTVAVLRRNR
ncbi:MAG: gliding motility-associated C-terminal domain-containing protein [Cyclobacteriaceae bacterium]|nr:gliding motility-associated C-terminal domain-containing protein [Cyclobacteriaceae bacterium]